MKRAICFEASFLRHCLRGDRCGEQKDPSGPIGWSSSRSQFLTDRKIERMTRRQLLARAALSYVSARQTRAQASRRPPNVLLILSDQHRRSCLGAAGDRVAKTPNLDSLAATAVRFTAYCTNPVCILSRRSPRSTPTTISRSITAHRCRQRIKRSRTISAGQGT
jgi:hypothetical protein